MEHALQALATDDNFNEEDYLRANPDVRSLVEQKAVTSGQAHFAEWGRLQGRYMRRPPSTFAETKRRKLERIRPILRQDLPMLEREGHYDFLSEELRRDFSIIDTSNVSSHGYDEAIMTLVRKYPEGLLLDCGAGCRPVYHDNVVNFEIVAYDTTDVLGVGEVLPFKDNTFDAVISIAVLEHVKDPWRCAKEIIRVLKPGGELLCAVPFLQPLHGYPNHFYNMSAQGLRNLFDASLAVDRMAVTPGTGPVHTLTWILRSWSEGLHGQTRQDFLNMRVAELTGHGALYMERPFAVELSEEKNFELASACILWAHKPDGMGADLTASFFSGPKENGQTAAVSMEPYDPLEMPVQQGPILASLLNFRPICEPIIKAWEPRSICEVGIEAGMASQWLVELGSTLKCEYHAVDPTVQAAPFTSAEGGVAHFHPKTSHEYLAEAPLHDVYFIDGDHNYFTVSRELQLIADKAGAAGKRPLIFLHDVSWPWARRDLYYRPDDIPAEARQESIVGGSLHPDVVATAPPGGFQPAGSHPFARHASKDRNGVLTAVEDFLAGASGWEFLMLPNGFGLGLLVPIADLTPQRDAALAPLRTALKCLDPFLKQLEYNRVALICGFLDNHRLYRQALQDVTTIQNRLNDASSRIQSLNLQADHAIAAKEALALHLHHKLSVDHARFAEEKREWKEMREQWKTGKQKAQKQFRDAIHHVRALQSGILPSPRRRKEAREFLAGINEKTFLDLPAKPKVPAPAPAAQAPASPPPPPAAPSPTGASPQGQAFDALNYYESRAPHPQNVLDAFHGDWSSAMPPGSDVSAEPGRAKLFDDDRVLWAHQSLGGFEGQEVLELGPLEGAHTWTLQKLGAKSITAIEANRRAFLKCLCIKEVFKMDRASFLLGDFVAYLKESTARYDTIVACGVLYHMTDPMELLGLIARATDRVFLWTHYYDPAVILAKPDLARRFRDLEQAEHEGLAYESAQQSYQEAVQWSGFCGGSRPTSRWLSRQSILDAFKHFGFGSIEIGFDQPDHPNGPAFAVCAKRVPA